MTEAASILEANHGLITNIVRGTDTDAITWDMQSFSLLGAELYHLYGRPGTEVQGIRFDLPVSPIFRLGDAITLWGIPTNAIVYFCSGADAFHAMADIRFNGNIEVRTDEFFNDWGGQSTPSSVQLDGQTTLAMIRYYADSFDLTWHWSSLPKWTGYRTWLVSEFGHLSMCGM